MATGVKNTPAFNPPRGRPREFDVDAALHTALRVFWDRGYEGASMTELADRMNIGKPSLYAAFGNKEELFRKALDLYERENMAFVAVAVQEPTSRKMAQRLLAGAIEMQAGHPDEKGCLGFIGVVTCAPETSPIRDHVTERQKSAQARLTARLEYFRETGDLPTDIDAAALARYLRALLQGLSVQAGAGASCQELYRIVEIALDCWPSR